MTEFEAARFRALLAENAQREKEPLNLYEALPAVEAFHRSLAWERLLRAGNRAGKTVAAMIELARAALGKDPYGKFPNDRPLTIWIICYKESQIGRTAYRLLFKPGAFDIIKDAVTGVWRTYHPWDPADVARKKEKRLAPPLIPRRYADPEKDISWKNKKEEIWSSVKLNMPGSPMGGTMIYAFPAGNIVPPSGDPVDAIVIDEDLVYPKWMAELESRLSDRKGRLWWSGRPHGVNNAMKDLSDRAEEDRGLEHPDVEEFLFTFSGNPHIDPEEKRKRLKGWSDEERRARDLGEFVMDDVLVYPTFHIDVHGVPKTDIDKKPERALDEALLKKQIPPDWTRYMYVDPGHTVLAALFLAVPPPRIYGDHVVAYDELYIKNCDAVTFGKRVEQKVLGQQFRSFIIDEHGGRLTDIGSGRRPKIQYSEQLKLRNIRSETTGWGFMAGSDDIEGRQTAARVWLVIREDGTSKFRVMKGRCPMLEWEFARFKKRICQDETEDKPRKGKDHLMHCFEYAAAHRPRYHPPKTPEKDEDPILKEFEEWMEAMHPGRGKHVNLGPGSGQRTSQHAY